MKRRRANSDPSVYSVQTPENSLNNAVHPAKAMKVASAWPPFAWYERLSLQDQVSGTCNGIVRWPRNEAGWLKFLEYARWATNMDLLAPAHVWKNACSRSYVFDMSRWEQVRLIRIWPINVDRVHAAIKDHPPSKELQKLLYEAVLRYHAVVSRDSYVHGP